jgi:hypothetical protein
MLKDLMSFCNHLNFEPNKVISNHSCIGRLTFRAGLAKGIAERRLRFDDFHQVVETRETSFKFIPELANAMEATSFRGFWQHFKYVIPNQNPIFYELDSFLSAFVPLPHSLAAIFSSPRQGSINAELSKRHGSQRKSLVLHIRRGDFLIRKRPIEEGLIALDSYRRILDQILEKEDCEIYTLTDDPQFLAQEGIDSAFGKVLGPESVRTWQALRIMSNSDYLVAGNSNLSWWGSFLCLQNGGKAYLPSRYYRTLEADEAYRYPGTLTYENNFIEIP